MHACSDRVRSNSANDAIRIQKISKIHPHHLERLQLKTEHGRGDGSVRVFEDLSVPLHPKPGDYSTEGASHTSQESLRDVLLLKLADDGCGNVQQG